MHDVMQLFVAMMTPMSVGGAIFLMVAHGITSAGLFFIVGVVYDRLLHRELDRMGGVAAAMPLYARLATLLMFASLGLPGFSNFVGEILILLGTFSAARGGIVATRARAAQSRKQRSDQQFVHAELDCSSRARFETPSNEPNYVMSGDVSVR